MNYQAYKTAVGTFYIDDERGDLQWSPPGADAQICIAQVYGSPPVLRLGIMPNYRYPDDIPRPPIIPLKTGTAAELLPYLEMYAYALMYTLPVNSPVSG